MLAALLVADNQGAVAAVVVASIVVPVIVLLVVLGLLWRSARRQDAQAPTDAGGPDAPLR